MIATSIPRRLKGFCLESYRMLLLSLHLGRRRLLPCRRRLLGCLPAAFRRRVVDHDVVDALVLPERREAENEH